MKKSDNFLSDFLFFCRCCSTGRNMGGLRRLRGLGRMGKNGKNGEEWEGMSSKLVLAAHSSVKLFLISS